MNIFWHNLIKRTFIEIKFDKMVHKTVDQENASFVYKAIKTTTST